MTLASLKAKLESLTPRGKLLASLLPAQRRFLEDKSHLKAALCTRRAGKSHSAAAILYMAASSKPNTVALYLALTRRSAKAIMWHKLKELDRAFGLEMKFSEADLIVTLTNGSRIVIFAADIENLSDRLRGDAYISVVIDEAQSYGTHLQYLIDDVLEPATLDHSGSISLIGTPGPIPAGVFFDATTTRTHYSTHRWSILDNSYLPHASNWIATLKKQRGWSDDNPTWRREYLGEWCQDPDALVYKFLRSRNIYRDLPMHESEFTHIIGLDYGWNDQTAFSIIAYSPKHPNAYVRECYGRSEMIPSRVAEELQRLIKRYQPERIVADTGGLGKSITEEMRLRYGLPIVAAEKTDKLSAIDAINGDFIDKRILVHESCLALMTQFEQLTWDDKQKENPTLPNDLCDATNYPLRWSRHYWGKVPVVVTLQDQLEREILDFAMPAKQNTNWWEL